MTAPASDTFSARLAEGLVALRASRFSAAVDARVRHCLLDWMAVAIAGAREPAAEIARQSVLAEGGTPRATVIGDARRTSASSAALLNAMAAHALDYDASTIWALSHATTPVIAAALALGEERDMSGGDLAAAIIVGIEATCVVSLATLRSTDARGFHQTGITGAFGAAAACGTLLGFDALRMRRTLGLAATQAAGLRAVFGSMGKTLNAGKPASDGLLAAKLIDAGFTAPDEAIEGVGGFAAAYGESFDPARPGREMAGRLGIESTVFKYHANCHGAHSTIDAIRALRARYGFEADAVRNVRVRVPGGLLRICGIAEPRDAHESQFSLAHAAALALAGESTGPGGFTAAKVADPRLGRLRKLVQAASFPGILPTESPVEVTVTLASQTLPTERCEALHFTDNNGLPDEESRLSQKCTELLEPILGGARSAVLLSRLQSFGPATRLRDLTEY